MRLALLLAIGGCCLPSAAESDTLPDLPWANQVTVAHAFSEGTVLVLSPAPAAWGSQHPGALLPAGGSAWRPLEGPSISWQAAGGERVYAVYHGSEGSHLGWFDASGAWSEQPRPLPLDEGEGVNGLVVSAAGEALLWTWRDDRGARMFRAEGDEIRVMDDPPWFSASQALPLPSGGVLFGVSHDPNHRDPSFRETAILQADGAWTTGPRLLARRDHPAMGATADGVLVIATDDATPGAEWLAPGASRGEAVEAPEDDGQSVLALADGSLLILGQAATWRYTPSTGFERAADPSVRRAGAHAVQLPDQAVLVIGGASDDRVTRIDRLEP